MKFSVASEILDPDAEGWERVVEKWGPEVEGWGLEGSAMIAGRLTRRRSVARGHSIWPGQMSWKDQDSLSTRRSYIPLTLERFQVYKGPGDSVITQVGLVLL